jgi:hypothetical protein
MDRLMSVIPLKPDVMTLTAVKRAAQCASDRCDMESGSSAETLAAEIKWSALQMLAGQLEDEIKDAAGHYFCPVCHAVIEATAVVYGENDGIDCQRQGREHTVYLTVAP